MARVLGEMLGNLGSMPATILYPFEKVPVPHGFRGRVEIVDEACIGCGKCAQVCPAQCIAMVKDETEREVETKGKKIRRKRRPEVLVMRCIRCGLCEEYCAQERKGIHLTEAFTGSGPDREVLVR